MLNKSLKATAIVLPSTVPPEVKITFQDQELSFSISRFGRDNFQKAEFDVFEQINLFWANLPLEKQSKIFNIYREVHQAYDWPYTKEELLDFLTDRSTMLLEYHDLALIRDWIDFKSNLQIPEVFVAEYVHDIDNNTTRDKTYTRGDYKDLIGLSLCLRCMIPIWGEYIAMIKQDTGNDFKELYAFQTINKSALLNSTPMVKLKTYIKHLTVDKHTPDNVLKGICSEDFVYWLLSLLCIKRLTIADIRGSASTANIMQYIYKFIVQKIQNRDNNFENSYKEKKYDDHGAGNQENKISTVEKYKIKTSISPGEIVELEYTLQDPYKVAHKLTSRINDEQLMMSLQTCQVLNEHPTVEPQLLLLSWVFKPVISPRGLMYIRKESIVNSLGVLESVLWARGHEYLSILSTCHPVIHEKEMVISPVDSKMRLPKELSDEIERLYPFTRPAMSNKRKAVAKSSNIVLDAIDQLVDQLTMYSWKSTASIDKINKVFGNSNRQFIIRPDIKQYIGHLVIEVGSRSWL